MSDPLLDDGNEIFDKPFNPEPRPRNTFGRVMVINLVIGLISLAFFFTNSELAMIGLMIFLAQVSLNFFAGLILVFFQSAREAGKAMLLSSLLIGILGLGTCGIMLSSMKF